MKKLGIIGGYSYKSTIYYYDQIVYALRGQCDITIRSIDYTIFDRHTEANDLNGLRMFLQEAVNDLLMVGCEIIAIACNTAHIVKEKLEFGKAVFVDIVSAMANHLAKEGIRSALIFGTTLTVTVNFMKNDFDKKGIELISADDNPHFATLDAILCDYCASPGMAPHTTMANDAIIPIFNMLERHKVDAFIFGCTELPLLCDGRQFEKKFNSHYVSSCDVHIESIITAMRA